MVPNQFPQISAARNLQQRSVDFGRYPQISWVYGRFHRSRTHEICSRDPAKRPYTQDIRGNRPKSTDLGLTKSASEIRGKLGDVMIHWRHLRYQAQRCRGGDPWKSAETKRSLATQAVRSAGDPGKPCYRSLIHCSFLSSQPKRSCPEPAWLHRRPLNIGSVEAGGQKCRTRNIAGILARDRLQGPPGARSAGLGLGDILKRLPQGSPKNSLIAVARRSHISGGYTWLSLESLSPASVPSNLRWYS